MENDFGSTLFLGLCLLLGIALILVGVGHWNRTRAELPYMNPGSHAIHKHGRDATESWKLVNSLLEAGRMPQCEDCPGPDEDPSGQYFCTSGTVLEIAANGSKFSIVVHDADKIITSFKSRSRKYVQNSIKRCIN